MKARRIHPLALAAALILGSAVPAAAQQLALPGSDASDGLVERVVAVVGDSVVTLTQVQEYLIQLQAQGQELPTDPEALGELRREALDALVNQLLVIQEAARDSIFLPDEVEIEQRVAQRLQQITDRFGNQEVFQQALAREGLTQAAYREQLRNQIRRGQIQELYIRSRVRSAPPVSVTSDELREAFEARKASLGERPEMVTIRQLALRSGASDSAWAQTEREAQSLLDSVRAGADFAELATEHSADPGSATNGGDLGWFRRGQMVREFEEVAFRLPDGAVSQPVRTDFGWHIIKVERSRPGEVRARHILLRPEVDEGADEVALEMAREAAERIRAGESVAEVRRAYADHLDTSVPDSLTFPRAQMDRLPGAWREPLQDATEGAVVGPFPFTPRDATEYVVARVTEVRPAGEYTFEDLRDQLHEQLREQKQIQRILERLRERAYVDIRVGSG